MRMKRAVIGILLFCLAGFIIFWMSGGLALPENAQVDQLVRAWFDPGFLAFPLLVAGGSILIGAWLLMVKPIKTNDR